MFLVACLQVQQGVDAEQPLPPPPSPPRPEHKEGAFHVVLHGPPAVPPPPVGHHSGVFARAMGGIHVLGAHRICF